MKDKEAFEYLYNNYSSAIFGVILNIVGVKDYAEELTQDCFMKIWSKIGDYNKEKGRLFTWMINIARNLAIDKLRSKEFRSVLKSDDIGNHGYMADIQYSEKFKPEYIGISEIVKNLKPEQKDLLDMMYFKGYSQSEISEELNMPLGTVKTRVRSAIILLRSVFK